ncbi:LuxR C-terminal-related transcriptional regulator [Propioniciclava tarda]|uniref:Response regulator transcription factor n=1 Tax=Propioniciclava tarda TaxID=433330 RepID=A0A4Q9KP06_PROTD|nr:response regulator transcription factor [Propioniciclava tarda]TBT96312.1 response regulator transcription factor [Propioniciclava tarda]SMO35248.1 two component transcriptional regulator, LuxR family [Propioniciclava tarda]HOA89229.1 response regulator transcription factor [Propioniciclava tarda]HQA31382.1 response regulator transcription factor [Propioniciclava tarda]HQD60944.1 response regulator transcription factor [Propioniciclava tarda]
MGTLRVVVVDDSGIFREGLVALLNAAGVEVVEALASTEGLGAAIVLNRPDAVVLDVRLPPTFTDEGVQAAVATRKQNAGVGILLLSTYAEPAWVRRITDRIPQGIGYLIKDRVADVERLVEAIEIVASGGIAIDSAIVHGVVSDQRPGQLSGLTEREIEVLSGIAEGRSNAAIARTLGTSVRTIESHVASILRTLGIPESPDAHRRVLAALAFVQGQHAL